MRINERLVVQAVGSDRVVFIDTTTDTEVVVTTSNIPALARRLDQYSSTQSHYLPLAPGLNITAREFVMVAFALGYFWAALPGGPEETDE